MIARQVTPTFPCWSLLVFLCILGAAGLLQASPYATIYRQNRFRLTTPALPVPEPLVQPAENLPQVRLTGLTDITGRKRALLEFVLAGQPVRSEAATLGEGERLHGVEVLDIDLAGDRAVLRMEANRSFTVFLSGRGTVSAMQAALERPRRK